MMLALMTAVTFCLTVKVGGVAPVVWMMRLKGAAPWSMTHGRLFDGLSKTRLPMVLSTPVVGLLPSATMNTGTFALLSVNVVLLVRPPVAKVAVLSAPSAMTPPCQLPATSQKAGWLVTLVQEPFAARAADGMMPAAINATARIRDQTWFVRLPMPL